MERVHERAGTIVNRLPGDGSVVRVHNAVDKAERHPLGDQIRLGIRDRLQQSQIRIWRLSGGRVVSRNDVIGKHLQAINIVACQKILKSPDPNVTYSNASEHAPWQRPFLAHNFLPGCNGGERAGGGNPKSGHGFAHNVFPEDRTEGGFAIAATGESRASRSLQLQIVTCAVSADHFTEQKGAAVAELRRESAELMASIGLCNRLGTLGNRIARKHRDAVR